jgi:hypothetical protein
MAEFKSIRCDNTSSTAWQIGRSTPCLWPSATTAGALATPSVTALRSPECSERLAAAQRQPAGHVARLRRGAGQHQIAQPAQARQRLARPPSASPRRVISAKPRAISAAWADLPSPCPPPRPRRWPGHSSPPRRLQRRSDHRSNRAGRSGEPIAAIKRLAQRLIAQASVTAVGRPLTTSAAKLGPDSTAGHRLRYGLAQHLGHQRQRAALKPLGAQSSTGAPSAMTSAKRSKRGARVLGRADQKIGVAAGQSRLGSLVAVIALWSGAPGRNTVFSWPVLIASTTSARTPRGAHRADQGAGLRQGRAPGAGADHANSGHLAH